MISFTATYNWAKNKVKFKILDLKNIEIESHDVNLTIILNMGPLKTQKFKPKNRMGDIFIY